VGRSNGYLAPVLRAVTFDFWNTLMWEEHGDLKAKRLEFWAQHLPATGASVDAAALERAHDAAHRLYEESWRAGRQFRVEHAARLIVREFDGALGPDSEAVLLEGFDEAGRRSAIHPSGGVDKCLATLDEAGVKLGIICDIGLTPSYVVRELLERHDLLQYFAGTTFSDEVGSYKPSRAAFDHALASVGGVEPGAAAHVGDRLRTDVAGAREAGMTSVRYSGVYEDPAAGLEEADIVIADLAALPDALGVFRSGA
jgi:FMN phosphatase YigB (HAD superfamily)